MLFCAVLRRAAAKKATAASNGKENDDTKGKAGKKDRDEEKDPKGSKSNSKLTVPSQSKSKISDSEDEPVGLAREMVGLVVRRSSSDGLF